MKNLIITIALAALFSMLICFQWELNRRNWHSLRYEHQTETVNSAFLGK